MAEQTAKQQEGKLDENFYERADAYINMANKHVQDGVNPGMVANSLMFAATRFNSWTTAVGYPHAEDLAKEKEEILKFFTEQYRLMLSENLDSYIKNFDEYLGYDKEKK